LFLSFIEKSVFLTSCVRAEHKLSRHGNARWRFVPCPPAELDCISQPLDLQESFFPATGTSGGGCPEGLPNCEEILLARFGQLVWLREIALASKAVM
jgi:hypothetical protein